MKKIICFTESLGGGGAEHQIVILSGLLAELGYKVFIVTFADVPDHYDLPNGVCRIKIAENKSRFSKLLHIFFFFMRTNAECVISYRQMSNIRSLLPLFFRRRVKVICSERNTTLGNPDLYRRFLVHVLYKRADYVVPNSDSQTKYMKNENPKLIPKLRTIHNYTDLDYYKMSSLPRDLDVIKIVILARFSPQKNPIRFVEALRLLKQKTIHPFEVHWYGNQIGNVQGFSPEYLRVKSKVEELGIGDFFFLHPAVKDPSALMSDFHAVCLPSLYEGFSNSIAEAICCGKPMLVSDVADNSVMVHDGVNGFLFDPKQVESICDAFMKFFNLSHEEMEQMAKNSRRIAENLFDKDGFIKQYVELIES